MEQLLKQVIADVLKIDPVGVNGDLSIDNCEKWDSLKHIELMSSIEDNFDIERLSMDEITMMVNYPAIRQVLAEKLEG